MVALGRGDSGGDVVTVQSLGYDAPSDATQSLAGTQATYALHLHAAPASTDDTAPTVTPVTPTTSRLAASDEIVIDVDDDVALGYTGVFVSFNGKPKQAVFRRGAFETGFALLSSVESLNGGKKQRLHIRPDSRWPSGTIEITVDPVDAGGNVGS